MRCFTWMRHTVSTIYVGIYEMSAYNVINLFHANKGRFFLVKALEKLNRQLADADAALEARKKPVEDAGPKIIGEGLVIDEWVCLHSFRLEVFLRLCYF